MYDENKKKYVYFSTERGVSEIEIGIHKDTYVIDVLNLEKGEKGE